MKIEKFIKYSLFVLILQSCNQRNSIIIKSPDSSIKINFSILEDNLSYNVYFKDSFLIGPSALSLKTNLEAIDQVKIEKVEYSESNETWEPAFGKVSKILNHYNEGAIHIVTEAGTRMVIRCRAYNDGFAFRYEIPLQKGIDSITVISDETEFRFVANCIARGIDENVESSEFNPKPLSQLKYSKLPLLIQSSLAWMALNEAAVFDFSMMNVINKDGANVLTADIGVSACKLPMKTPWRVIQIGKSAGDLIESNILLNLNEPCKIADTSWIRPGKSMWDWRNHGDTINGFVYGLNEESYKRLIEFSSENSFEYVLFDGGWYGEKGPEFFREEINMPELIRYAKKKNVKVLLYVDRRPERGVNDWNLEEVLKTFREWGVAGIKYGFLSSAIKDRKSFVDTTWIITRLCAKYQMMVLFHDNPLQTGGGERSWPNLITREYCHAQQDARKSFGPYKAVIVPFVNGLSGPLDMANGYYDLNGLQNREKVDKKGMNSTVVGETARCLVNYTPLMILPDNGDVYSQKADLFSFIKEMPDTWDETRVLDGLPGEFIIVARRSGNNWFVGANTNEDARTCSISLNFLGEGTYKITTYQDSAESDFKSNKESYTIADISGTSKSLINAVMAPGGGFCMKIMQEK